jgi:putative DNA primase/helicase
LKLSDFLGRFDDLARDGQNWLTYCPAHDDHRPSLIVAVGSDRRLLLHCRAGCPTSAVLDALGLRAADLFDVVVDIDPGDVAEVMAATFSGPSPTMLAHLRDYLVAAADVAALDTTARRYARRRFGLTKRQFEALGLGYDPGGSAALYHPQRGPVFARVPRLVVPFRDFSGVAHGVQGRALADDDVRWSGFRNGPQGEPWARYGVFYACDQPAPAVVITEGPGDALTAVAAGYDAVCIRGAAMGDVAASFRENLAGRVVLVAGDNDPAGQRFNDAVLAAVPWAVVLTLPEGVNDLSAWYEADPGRFVLAIREARRQASEAMREAKRQARERIKAVLDPGDGYPLNPLGYAYRLRDRLDGVVKFTPETGFLMFNGVAWSQGADVYVRRELQDLLTELLDRFAGMGTDAGDRLAATVGRAMNAHTIDLILKDFGVLEGVRCDYAEFDTHPDLLACRNGVVDLRTGRLVEGDTRGLMLTRQLSVDYDPAAECPRWSQFLAEVFPGDPDTPAYLQRLIGYGITGHNREQCFAIFYGLGANGKSVFTETIGEVFHAISSFTPFATFEDRQAGGIPNDLAALKGSRLVFATEGEANKRLSESAIKRATGSDTISARFLHREFFEFRPQFLLMLSTNHKPLLRGQDNGLWRRVRLIEWGRTFAPEEQDLRLREKLQAEAAGILAWAVRGAVEWYAHRLREPESMRQAVAEYRESSDILAGFFPGVLVVEPGHKELAAHVFERYVAWADAGNIDRREQLGRTSLYRALGERGISIKKGMYGMVCYDVKLMPAQSIYDVIPDRYSYA